uniref:Autophagy-related protein 9 n=1 Tax=Pseudo-nitzschia delicatissima TaxID=44447 RepID=A0A7S0TCB0_9STRA|mmetsp:Transcript_647/g.1478  ORF Transcript_647/g.1478 Transcript_647/m.1478 type:complete len:1202 (+) Transcript_647:215-3820(+)
MADHSRIQHRYHALPAVSTVDAGAEAHEDGDVVWDQLNDAQSREVQQHESRFYNGDRYGRDNPLSIAWSMAHQTANSAGTAVRQTAEKARDAVVEWQQNQLHNDYYNAARRRNGDNANLNDVADEFDLQFGIQDLLRRGGESSLSMDAAAENHSYVNGNRNGVAHREEILPAQENKKEEQPLKGYPFVLLKEGRDVPDRNNYNLHNRSERDRWGVVGNLDVFLTHLYKYYYHRGLTPMLCSFLVETTCLLFTIWLTRLLLIDVNWPKLLTMNCDEEFDNTNDNGEESNSGCHSHLSDYARTDPLSWTAYLLIHGYTFLLLVYAIFKSWVFYQDFFGYALQCRTILHDKLGLSERKLHSGALSWDDVVTKLAEGQESGSYKIIQHPTNTVSPFRTRPPSSHHSKFAPMQSVSEDVEAQDHMGEQSQSTQPIPTPVANEGATTTPSAPPAAAFDLPTNPSKLQHHQNQSLLDPLQIAQRIMRKENFMLAFWNAGLLDCTKIVFPWSGGSDGTQRHYWCGVLEWSFYQCVLNFMFNHKYELRPAFCLDSDALKRRLKVCGIVLLCFLPFLLVFMVLHFFLSHVYDSKMGSTAGNDKKNGTGGVMGNPRWSSAAIWQFREFNELPHAFEKRIEPSYNAASEYCKLFGTSEYLAALGRLFKFFGGSIGGILFVLGVVVNDDLLLHVQFGGRNLLWYAGIAGITYSVGKALEPTKEATLSAARNNIFEDMDTALKNISQHTHYYPEHWKGRGWDTKVYASFKTLFDVEVKLFLHELSALILTPYILYFRLSEKASDICEFCLVSKAKLVLSANNSTVNGGGGIVAGDVCGFSTFDFDTFGDEAWEGRTLGRSVMLERQRQEQGGGGGESLTESIMRTGNLEDATRMHPKPRARHGKMEKSFFTFKAAHPNWDACFPPSGQSLVNRVEEYRVSTEQAMIARERELHAQAAMRQLETLARIEEEQSNQHASQHARMAYQTNIRWNDQHYVADPVQAPPVDAFAGSRSQSPLSPPPLRRATSPLPPTVQNTPQTQAEVVTLHIKEIPSSLPPSTEKPVAGNSSPEISLPFSPGNSTSAKAEPLRSSRESSDFVDNSEYNNSLAVPDNPSTLESHPFEYQNGGSALSNTSVAIPQQSSSSRYGLALSSSGLSSSLQQDRRDSQAQYNWLERFHEHLEKQEEEAQHQNGVPSEGENKNISGDGGSRSTSSSS